jgi:actin-related protein
MESNDILVDMGSFETLIGKAGGDNFELKESTAYSDSNNPLIKKSLISKLSDMAKERIYGNAAFKFKNVLNIDYFLKNKDYISFSALLQQSLEKMYVDPKDVGLVLLLPSNFGSIDRQKLQTTLFQGLQIPRLCFLPQSLCAFTAVGLSSGVMVDIGYYSTRIESVFKGFPKIEAQFELPIGGHHITQCLMNEIFSKTKYKSASPLYWVAEDIKRAVVACEVDLSPIIQAVLQGKTDYDQLIELPDGSQYTINRERFECVEVVFNPELGHLRSEGIIQAIENSVRSWERTQIPELLKNIIVCGNGSKIPGLIQKIEAKLKEKFSSGVEIKVLSVNDSKGLCWIGGSVLYAKKQGQLDWISNPFLEVEG